jgi:hypothetical protein
MAHNVGNMASKANYRPRYEALTLHGFCAILRVSKRILLITK